MKILTMMLEHEELYSEGIEYLFMLPLLWATSPVVISAKARVPSLFQR